MSPNNHRSKSRFTYSLNHARGGLSVFGCGQLLKFSAPLLGYAVVVVFALVEKDAALVEEGVHFRGFEAVEDKKVDDVGLRRAFGDEAHKLCAVVHELNGNSGFRMSWSDTRATAKIVAKKRVTGNGVNKGSGALRCA